MKKIIFSALAGIFGSILFHSCGGGGIDVPVQTPNNEINEWIYEIFRDNYLWDVEKHSEYIWTLPSTYFDHLKNADDNNSSIWKNTDVVSSSYDIGFEYTAARYNDGKIYYVIFYVKPGTQAESEGLQRGDLILKVNNKEISESEAATLLINACKDGNTVNLVYVRPGESEQYKADIVPKVITNENPVYTSAITNLGNKKVGYLLYNKFIPGNQSINENTGETLYDNTYDNALAEVLQDFYYKGVSHLVLDLRYNPGGSLTSAGYLGSALVRIRNASDDFITYKRREDLEVTNPISPIKLTDKINEGVSIPRLGDNLEKIYIITGTYTAGAGEAFINAIKAYRGNNVIIVGQKTAGAGNISVSNTASKNEWLLSIALAYITDKNGEYDYAEGFNPDLTVYDLSGDVNQTLQPLGSSEETVYKAVLALIRGTSARALQETGPVDIANTSSVINKPWAGKSIVESDSRR